MSCEHSSAGRLFLTVELWIVKLQSFFVRGTAGWPAMAGLGWDLPRWDAGTQSVAGYDETRPWRHLYVSNQLWKIPIH